MTVLELLDELGIRLDPQLLAVALTHRSYAFEHGGIEHNERLEFLGDAVLGIVVTEALFFAQPDAPEGRLAKQRSAVVSSVGLAAAARAHDLGTLIRLGRGEVLTGGSDKTSILADATEALIGAVYSAEGMESAKRFVLALLADEIAEVKTRSVSLDWKSSLQELTPGPRYEVTSTGPDHAREFTAKVFVDGVCLGTGSGRSKKHAEQLAAQQAYQALKDESDAGTA